MNLAILIGVDKYDMPNKDLPGCKNDVLLMNELLVNMETFGDIVLINSNEDSKEVKDKILNKIAEYKNNKTSIEQFFFYFTGHGTIYENELYYALKDFDSRKLKQSSLENSELDAWIRDLNPQTTIKVIDACHSGKQYIKNMEDANLQMKKVIKSINNCYFFSSSKSDQVSYGGSAYSEFTYSFVEAILKSKEGDIRYKEIADYISDYFPKEGPQTPYFVTQSDYTEVFGKVSKELKVKVNSLIESFKKGSDYSKNKTNNILLDAIKADAEKYCTEEEMMNILSKLSENIKKYKGDDKEFEDLYRLNIESKEIPEGLDLSAIGRWLEENNNYFAKPTYRKEEYTELEKVKKKGAIGIENIIFRSPWDKFNYEEKEVVKYRNVVSGFELTQEVEYECIKINYLPKYPNLNKFCTYIFFVFSKKDIVLFICNLSFKEVNWKNYKTKLDNDWNIEIIEAKKEEQLYKYISDYINSKCKNIKKDIIKSLK